MLLHHVAETLLRLYIAHESDPECPWIAIASERNFGRFKGKVSELLKSKGALIERYVRIEVGQ